MLIVRLLIFLFALVLVLCAAMFFVTHDRRYLKLAWQSIRFGMLLSGALAVLFVLERFVLTGWGAFL